MDAYEPKTIEPKWQQFWEQERLFKVDSRDATQKYYCLNMFPYPSGTLHVGHGRNYIIGDVVTRSLLMRGRRVICPMGWDAFGLPAENAAIKTGIHPKTSTWDNIRKIKAQMARWGVGYDWDRELASCEPDYYRWTQWIFLQLHARGLAYKKRAGVNWCPSCQTVLANEQVVGDGVCDRCHTPVEERELEQWFFKITDYAERLLTDLRQIEGGWPERVRSMQAEWIGRSEGAEVAFSVAETGEPLPCFTTRPDTLWGVTYYVVAPEHGIVERLVRGTAREALVAAFVKQCKAQGTRARTAAETVKEGMPLGVHVTNPVTGERVPLWIANYALLAYGTGAVMAVPAHDQRDFEFARKYGLPVRVVIHPPGRELGAAAMTEAYVDDGTMAGSAEFTGMGSAEARGAIVRWLAAEKKGRAAVHYRLRDWLISRQRYWGCPIPIVYCDRCGTVPVPEQDLPVLLPEIQEYQPKGKSPLAGCEAFVRAACPRCQGPGRRETDTMDTFVDSAWYFLRFISAQDDRQAWDTNEVNRWLPVDQYIGGAEHATKHLIYARFLTKVFQDMRLVSFAEPFANLFNQGLICKKTHWCPRCKKYRTDQEVQDERCPACGAATIVSLQKMSKSLGNVVSADELIERFGADTQRLYTLFIGPPEKDAEWQDDQVMGAHRFLNRVWDLVIGSLDRVRGAPPPPRTNEVEGAWRALLRKTHQTIARLTQAVEGGFQFNTSIAALMELSNEIRGLAAPPASDRERAVLAHAVQSLVMLLGPFVPHLGEELWQRLGGQGSLFRQPWPTFDPAATKAEEIELVIQVNGKPRAKITVEAGLDRADLEARALAHERVQQYTGGKPPKKVIVVPDKLVNVVV